MKLYAILFTAITIVTSITGAATLDRSDSNPGSDLSQANEKRTCRINDLPWGDDVDTAITKCRKPARTGSSANTSREPTGTTDGSARCSTTRAPRNTSASLHRKG